MLGLLGVAEKDSLPDLASPPLASYFVGSILMWDCPLAIIEFVAPILERLTAENLVFWGIFVAAATLISMFFGIVL